MGLGTDEDVVVDDSDTDGGGGGGKSFGTVSCSICLEVVTDNEDRSWAKLQCGHQFHLDCIGSAFNIKGAMQCPNCRKIEKGQWLYASCRSFPEFSRDDWAHDEDLYDLSFSEMSFGVQWCPFGSLTRLASSFEEGEFPSVGYHDLLGQPAVFADNTAVSSASHPCPYVAYFGPIHPPSSSSTTSVSEASSFNNHWNAASAPSEIPTPYTFTAVDPHYQSWEHHSSAFSASNHLGDADQPSVPPVNQRPTRANSDILRSGYYMPPSGPFFVGHSSAPRAGSSVTSPMVPPYPGSNARSRDRVQALQAYYQRPSNLQAMHTPIVPGSRRSANHRSLAQAGPVATSSDRSGGFYFFPPGSSGRNFQEAESPIPSHFHAWERDHLPPFSSIERDSGWNSIHQAGGSSDPGMRSSSFRQRHGSDRTSTQNR